jgi:ABC-2 type transport system ATP-binding protein
MNEVIRAKSVYKTYRSGFLKKRLTHALRGIDLSVGEGEIFGLLGPNGAGKTTLLNIFSCQLLPDSGQVWILGNEITRHAGLKLRSRLNMCSGNPNFPWSLTVEENLKFYSLLYGLSGKTLKKVISKYIEMFGLAKFRKIRYDELSTGNKQKLALAKALVNNPEVLFLDEPTIGLDPDMGKKIREVIRRIPEEMKTTIIVTTHYMRDAEELCGRIAFIKDGEIKALGTSDQLVDMTNTEDLEGAFLELAE